MTYFAGLDVSLEETAICVVDETAASSVRFEPRASRMHSSRLIQGMSADAVMNSPERRCMKQTIRFSSAAANGRACGPGA